MSEAIAAVFQGFYLMSGIKINAHCMMRENILLTVHIQQVAVFVYISLTADGPQRARLPIPPTATLPSCLPSRRIFPSHPGSRLTNFYRRASPALLQYNSSANV